MSVEIKFEPDGPSGSVPEGTSVMEAAKRLGLHIPAECEGRAECDTCAVKIITGATFLSDLTDGERKQLSAQRLAAGERLACQCKAERTGEVSLRITSTQRTRNAEEKTADLRREFSELPFERKVATLVQLEAIAMSQAFDTIADRSVAFGKMIFDSVSEGTKHTQEQPEDKRV
jgi:2Fe-2S ferredoxin